MRKSKVISTALIFFSFALGAPVAAADGLVVSVVNEKNIGVVSNIVAKKDNNEVIIGTTTPSGALPANKFKSDSDHNLIAKPVSGEYFDSAPASCSSPKKFLVISRMTPKGEMAFFNLSQEIALKDGGVGQFSLKPTIKVHALDKTLENTDQLKEGLCELDYDVNVEKQVFEFKNDGWYNVDYSEVPAASLVSMNNIRAGVKDVEGIHYVSHPLRFTINKKCDDATDVISAMEATIKSQVGMELTVGNFNKSTLARWTDFQK
jgi:hypothetical protein